MNGSPISILINAQLNEAQALSQLRTQVSQLQSRVGSININANVNSSQINNASGQLNNLASSANNAKKSTQSLFNTMGKVAMWGVVTGSVYGTIRAFKDMVAEIVTVDTKLTELRRVTQNGFDINGVLQDSIKLSSQLGNNLNDVLDTVNGFARAGNYSKQQLMDLTKVATVASNVSDLKPQDAMNDLIATMKAYGIEAQNTMGIVDKMNEVDNNYAISTQQIAESLKKASSTAKTFGVDINHLIADTTAIGQVTQESGSVIGNSLKTIYSRLTTVGSSVNTLKSLGVAIKDSSGDMRSASDILNDLADKWDTLTKAQQEQAAVSIAGRYQLSRFLALMTQHDQETQALTTSINSQGSAMRENAKYLDSMQAKINQMKNAFAELALAMGKAFASSGITSLVLGLTNLATAGVKIVQVFGGLPSIITAAYIAFMLFGGESRKYVTTMAGVNTVTGKFSNIFGELRATLALTKMQIEEETVGMTGLQRGFVSAGAAARTFGILFKEALIGTGIGIAIVAISFAIEKLVGHFSELHQAAVKEQEDMTTSSKNYQENKKEIDGLVESYSKLDKLKNTTGLSNKQQEEYLNIQQQLANVLPSVVAGTDSQGKSIIVSSDALKANIELIKQKIKLDHDSAVDSAPQTQQTSDNNIQSFQSQIKKKEDLVKGLNDQIKQSNLIMNSSTSSDFTKSTAQQSIISSTKQMDKAEQDILDLKTKIVGEQDKQKSSIQDILKIYTSLSGSDVAWLTNLGTKGSLSAKQIDDLGNKLNDLRSSLKQPLPSNFFDKMSATQIQSVISLVQGYKNGSISLVEFEKSLTNAGLTSKQVSTLIDDLTNAQKKNASSTKNDSKAMSDFTDSLKDASTYAGLLGKTLSGLKVDSNGSLIDEGQQLSELVNTYQILSDMEANGDKLTTAQKQLKKNAIDALNASYPNLIQNGKLNVDAAKKEADANSVLVDAYNKAAQGLLTDEQQMTLAKINQTKARIGEIEKEVEALDVAKKAYDDYLNSIQSELDAGASVDMARAQAISSGMKSTYNSSSMSNYKSELKALQGNLDGYTSSLKKSLDASSSSTSSTTKQTFVADKYADALAKVNEQQKLLENQQQSYDQNSQKYRDAIAAEIKLLQQKEDLLKSQTSSLNKQISSGNIQQTGLISTSYNTTTTSSSSSASGSSTAAQIWNYLAGKGLNDGAIAGIMGNLQQESGLRTTAVNPTSGAYGIAQWLGSRKSGLQNYASSNGMSTSSLSAQLGYLWKELSGGGNGSISTLNSLSASQAASYFEKMFERSGGSAVGARESNANSFYSKYSGSGSSSSSSSKTTKSGSSKAEQQQAVDQAKQQVLDLNGQISDIQAQIQQLNFQIVQSKLNEFEANQTKYDNSLSKLKDQESALNTTSDAYRANIESQTKALQSKQSSIKSELAYAEKEEKDTKLSAEAHAQLKLKVDSLNVSLADLTAQIQANNYAVIQSKMDQYQLAIDNLNHSLTLSKDSMQGLTQGTSAYNDAVKQQIDLLTQQEAQNKKEQAYIESQIKSGKLTAAQIQALNQQLNTLTESYASMQGEVTQYYTDLASNITDLYKQAYQDQEQAALDANQKEQDAAQKTHDQIVKNLSDQETAYNKVVQAQMDAIDKQQAAQSYQEDLSGKQKTVQGLQSQINTLSLDNSPEAKKKLADLNQQLADAQTAVNDTVSQHEADLRKQNLQDQLSAYQDDIDAKKQAEDDKLQATLDELNAEKDATQKYWDNIINDDAKYTKIQNDIISGHFDQVTKDLDGFKTNLESISSDIGDSVTKNLIDKITQAEDAMNKLNGTSGTSGSSSKPPSSGSSSSGGKTGSSGSSGSKSSGSSSSSKPPSKSVKYYTVKKGDTLSDIAEKYYGSAYPDNWQKIAKANHITDPKKLQIGTRLVIPSLASGGVVSVPTLIQAGDAGYGNPEIFAPEKKMTQIVTSGLYNAISKLPLIQAMLNLPKTTNNQNSVGDMTFNFTVNGNIDKNNAKNVTDGVFTLIKQGLDKRGIIT